MIGSTDRIILINKPLEWTSFDVVNKLKRPLLEEYKLLFPEAERKQIKKYKVGHAGTLDPLATGLLVICTGKLTKSIQQIQDAEKEYTGTITIGAVTPSYDLETVPFDLKNFSHVSEASILELAKTMEAVQQQIPPVHSAIKVNGQRAYTKARQGIELELKSREIEIKKFEITRINFPEIDFRVVCTKGTYIRSLANDFGKSLGVGGYLSALCRTRIGEYVITNAYSPGDFLAQLSGNNTFSSDKK